MSQEFETAKEIAGHPASWIATATAAIGWLGNKLWRAHRHEIANIQQTAESSNAAIWKEIDKRRAIEEKLFDQMRDHEKQDRDRFERQENASRDRHDELITIIGNLRADISGLKK